ncbi:hypothetical protein ACIKTA_19385, partial [Hansschlegelia beijingensis]
RSVQRIFHPGTLQRQRLLRLCRRRGLVDAGREHPGPPVGAPLGHDFAVISLSNLLKPWEIIAQRLEAAARADFVLALYNPTSRDRRPQFEAALDLLRLHRGPETVVALARNVGREGESLTIVTLGTLDPNDVDMRTLVLVGSSRSRVFARADGRPWMFTPRVYEAAPATETQEPLAL